MTCCQNYRKIVSGEAGGLGAGLARGALGVLSVPYRWGSSLVEVVQTGQRGTSVSVPVISVGNLTAGGTGKTPFVALLVERLRAAGRRPVVLSRGYKAEADGLNDEARVLERMFPDLIHLQGKDRVELAWRAATAQLGDVIVLDDGFQYHKLVRDLNVCLIDATNPFGYGSVFPRGILRESLSALYRARPVVITRAELASPAEIDAIKAEVLRHNEYATFVVTQMQFKRLTDIDGGAQGDVASLAGKRVVAASGIGNPESFVRGLRASGARVGAHVEHDDHHDWTQADVDALAAEATRTSAEVVVTTVKDAVKIARLSWPAGAPALRVVEVAVNVVEGDGILVKLVKEALA
jgi:tetraacyldisaccharide 4'-kinase